jgi:hypothetical protein
LPLVGSDSTLRTVAPGITRLRRYKLTKGLTWDLARSDDVGSYEKLGPHFRGLPQTVDSE